MTEVSIIIPTMNSAGIAGRWLYPVAGLDCHAGAAEIAGRHLGDRMVGIAERCGVFHGLAHACGWVTRSVSVHVLLWRRVVGWRRFLQGNVCALYLHLVERGGLIGDGGWARDEDRLSL